MRAFKLANKALQMPDY